MATAFSHADATVATQPLAGIDAVILAGGLGTRLRAVLPDRQKVMADIGGCPLLGRLIDFYTAAGVARIVLALGYRSDDVEDFIRRHGGQSNVIASIEPEPRGTGGALRYALPQLRSQTVLVANGDSFADVDFAKLLHLHRAQGCSITLALTSVDDVSRYGRVLFDNDGAVTRFEEKPALGADQPTSAGFINAGVYLIDRKIIASLPPNRSLSLERDVFPQWIGRGIYALAQQVPFIDIGIPETWAIASDFFAAIDKRRRTS
jgi:D-glycero-alpha-D-manno-heptose 1-phosphate guanylyltransferase